MENQVSSKSTMLNYGLLLGVASIFINLAAYALGIHLDQDWRIGTLGFLAMIVIIVKWAIFVHQCECWEGNNNILIHHSIS